MRRIIAIVVVCLAVSFHASAQSARVSGQVVDATLAAVQGSQVTLHNLETDGQFRTASTDEGGFQLPPVPPGRYEITAAAVGFAITRVTDLTLELGESKVMTLKLEPESLHESVTVAASTRLLPITSH